MIQTYIYGLKGIADFFGFSLAQLLYLIEHHGIPGIMKVKRRTFGNFPGGGRGVWAISRRLAEQYRHTRLNTPLYDPVRAVEALVNKFEGTGCKTIPELIEMGYIDDMDWCVELNRQRELSNLHVPILMNPVDLAKWMGVSVESVSKQDIYPETTNIFKKVRKTRG